jgi:hypothetical protein
MTVKIAVDRQPLCRPLRNTLLHDRDQAGVLIGTGVFVDLLRHDPRGIFAEGFLIKLGRDLPLLLVFLVAGLGKILDRAGRIRDGDAGRCVFVLTRRWLLGGQHLNLCDRRDGEANGGKTGDRMSDEP